MKNIAVSILLLMTFTPVVNTQQIDNAPKTTVGSASR